MDYPMSQPVQTDPMWWPKLTRMVLEQMSTRWADWQWVVWGVRLSPHPMEIRQSIQMQLNRRREDARKVADLNRWLKRQAR